MTGICIPLTGRNIEEDLESVERCRSSGADMVELRLDKLDDPYTGRDFPIRELGIKTVMTVRPRWEGGSFPGRDIERIALLHDCIDRQPDCIDIEAGTDEDLLSGILDHARKNGVGTIISFHQFDGSPDLDLICNKMKSMKGYGADIVKMAYTCSGFHDSVVLIKAGLKFRDMGIDHSIMGMGPFGQLTRILAPAIGCKIAYACLDDPDVEGQVKIGDLKMIWSLLSEGELHGG
jgi:3-dehydroquinate dehydratase type I